MHLYYSVATFVSVSAFALQLVSENKTKRNNVWLTKERSSDHVAEQTAPSEMVWLVYKILEKVTAEKVNNNNSIKCFALFDLIRNFLT